MKGAWLLTTLVGSDIPGTLIFTEIPGSNGEGGGGKFRRRRREEVAKGGRGRGTMEDADAEQSGKEEKAREGRKG